MTGGQPHSDPILTTDLWQTLFNQAYLFAFRYINRLPWRGAFGGVLPEGQDAESIAVQAVTDFFQAATVPKQFQASSDLGFQHFSLLSRYVWRIVDRLYHRNENRLLRNEPDLVSVRVDDGHECRLVETIPDLGANPLENLIHKETTTERDLLEIGFAQFLGGERRLKSLFNCYANGIWRPRDVASRLHLSTSATRNLQKRLHRRLRQFLEQQSTPAKQGRDRFSAF